MYPLIPHNPNIVISFSFYGFLPIMAKNSIATLFPIQKESISPVRDAFLENLRLQSRADYFQNSTRLTTLFSPSRNTTPHASSSLTTSPMTSQLSVKVVVRKSTEPFRS